MTRLPPAVSDWTQTDKSRARMLLTDALCLLAGSQEVMPSQSKADAIAELKVALGLPERVAG